MQSVPGDDLSGCCGTDKMREAECGFSCVKICIQGTKDRTSSMTANSNLREAKKARKRVTHIQGLNGLWLNLN